MWNPFHRHAWEILGVSVTCRRRRIRPFGGDASTETTIETDVTIITWRCGETHFKQKMLDGQVPEDVLVAVAERT